MRKMGKQHLVKVLNTTLMVTNKVNKANAELKYYDDTLGQFISGVSPTGVHGDMDTPISFATDTLKGLLKK